MSPRNKSCFRHCCSSPSFNLTSCLSLTVAAVFASASTGVVPAITVHSLPQASPVYRSMNGRRIMPKSSCSGDDSIDCLYMTGAIPVCGDYEERETSIGPSQLSICFFQRSTNAQRYHHMHAIPLLKLIPTSFYPTSVFYPDTPLLITN